MAFIKVHNVLGDQLLLNIYTIISVEEIVGTKKVKDKQEVVKQTRITDRNGKACVLKESFDEIADLVSKGCMIFSGDSGEAE